MELPLLAIQEDEALVLVLVMAIIMGSVVLIVRIHTNSARKTRIVELEAESRENQDRLKALMIQRGMSAAEIERVLQLESPGIAIKDPDEDPESMIVKAMSEQHYSAGDIRRVVRAAAGSPDGTTPELARIIKTMAGNWQSASDIEEYIRNRYARGQHA